MVVIHVVIVYDIMSIGHNIKDGSNGHFNHTDPSYQRSASLSLSLSRRLVFFYENKSVSEAPYVCIISSSFYCVTCVDYLWRGDPIDKGVFTVLTYSCW